jgi:hypothetical protein
MYDDRPLSPHESRRLSLATGILWLITFAASIPALYLFQPALDDPVGYVASGDHTTRIFLAVVLELTTIIANIGTAVLPYGLFKRQNEAAAMGFVAARIIEGTFMLIGVLSMLAVVSLAQTTSIADSAGSGSLAYTLAAIKDWTFVLGPGFVCGIGNGILFGWLMYRSGLLPRRMTYLGLIGGPMICVSGIAVMFGAGEPGGIFQSLATLPEFLWELSVGLYLTFKGFTPAPILSGLPTPKTSAPLATPAIATA